MGKHAVKSRIGKGKDKERLLMVLGREAIMLSLGGKRKYEGKTCKIVDEYAEGRYT